MGKRNTIFRNIHTHLKNEHKMEDGQARVLAKQALFQFRSAAFETTEDAFCKCNPDYCKYICQHTPSVLQFRTVEGDCNNLDNANLGAFETKFIREVEVGDKDAKEDIKIFHPKSKY